MSIPASQLVNVNPGVVSSAGNALSLNGLFLTQNTQMPTGAAYSFPSVAAVSNFFGPASAEAALAVYYFAGFDTSTIKPSAMLFAPFNLLARAAWLQSGSLASMSLTQLKTLTGVLTITLDGTVKTSTTITLSSATSFSNAATMIAAAFTTGPTVTWNPVNSTFVFTSTTTGATSSITFATGTLAASLNLTSATGAIISAGAVLDTATSAITNAAAASQNWAGFTTMWEPAIGDKQLFAAWTSAQNSRYAYAAWDTDGQAIVQGSTTCFGAIAKALAYNGVLPISGNAASIPSTTTLGTVALNIAAFVLGYMASLNFAQKNGRSAIAGLTQAGLIPSVTDGPSAITLVANGYSFYGAYATATQQFIQFQNGALFGKFPWLDTYANQIWLNAQFQLALMTLESQVGDIPYTPAGYGLINAAMQTPIAAGLNFGMIRAGVTLSTSQISQINQAAGVNAASQISTLGSYLQILDPGAAARIARTTPIVNFWYADGGAVQQLTLGSNAVL